MKILLDLDGVMNTTPTWRAVEHLEDGFMAFNENCVKNLAKILTATQANIVLTTTHPIHYDESLWQQLLQTRGVNTSHVSKVNDASTFAELSIRCTEIIAWVTAHPNEVFVIIDDKFLRDLPVIIKSK